jgi:hypothetical protein
MNIRPRVVKRIGGGGPPEGWWRGPAAVERAVRPTPLPPRCARSPFPASRGRMKLPLLVMTRPGQVAPPVVTAGLDPAIHAGFRPLRFAVLFDSRPVSMDHGGIGRAKRRRSSNGYARWRRRKGGARSLHHSLPACGETERAGEPTHRPGALAGAGQRNYQRASRGHGHRALGTLLCRES